MIPYNFSSFFSTASFSNFSIRYQLALYPNLDLEVMKPPLPPLDSEEIKRHNVNSMKTPMTNGIIREPYRRIRMRRGAKRKLNSYEMEQEAAKQAEYENLMYTMDPVRNLLYFFLIIL